jgi:ankyrin repeat protein
VAVIRTVHRRVRAVGEIEVVDRQGRSELHYCALSGSEDEARTLLDSGQDPDLRDRDGFTPLHLAAQQSNLPVASLLLERGASVDPVNKFGNTPLFVAVFNSQGRGELIRTLRNAGADPFKQNLSGQTPLGLARLIANHDVAQFFDDLES